MILNSSSALINIFTGAITGIALIAVYYLLFVVKKPKIYSKNVKMQMFMENHLSILSEYFWPTIFYWEGRLQTIFGLTKRIPNSYRLDYKREIIPLSDGGELGLDFLEPEIEPSPESKLVLLVLPGLTSSSQTSYVKTLIMGVRKSGATIIVFNNRGIGGVPLKTPRTHSAGNCDDLHEAITHIKNLYPDSRMMALGTSLGGMVLCQYLAAYPEEAKATFMTALVISTVWDYAAAMESLEKPYVNRHIINYGITQDVIFRCFKNKEILKQRSCWDFEKISRCKTGREFDSIFHVPQFGYKCFEDYQKDCTITNRIHKFSIPVFALNAYDDPMMPGPALPITEATLPESNLSLIVTKKGGHLGFLEGFTTKPKPFHYMERFTREFVFAVANYGEELL